MVEETPRWLDREALATYVSVRVDYIPRLAKGGKLPAPSYHLGPKCPRWDRAAVDACFEDGLASAGEESHEQRVQAAVEEVLRGR